MNKEKWSKIGIAVAGALMLFFGVVIGNRQESLHSGLSPAAAEFWALENNSRPEPEILFFEETPSPVLVAAKKAFPDYKVWRRADRHLAQFLEGGEIVLAYDVQALPLIQAGAEFYFYPLYTDAVVLVTNQGQLAEPVRGWQDVLAGSTAVSLPEQNPEQAYIWRAISYGLTGRFDRAAAQAYLSAMYDPGRLFWNNNIAPVQVMFYSNYLYGLRRRERKALFPQEGTLAFQVGLFSHHPLEAGEVAAIRQVYKSLNYLPPEKSFQPGGNSVLFAASRLDEFYGFGEINVPLERKVKKNHLYAPLPGWEYQVLAVTMISITIFWIAHINRTVIHMGVRRGLMINGLLIIGWIGVWVFKYSFYGGADYIRALWYSYYVFILTMPPVGLFIAINLERHDKSEFPLRLMIVCVISIALMMLALSNDLHQQFFRFLTSDRNLWHKRFKHSWGYYLAAVWLVLSQFGVWVYLAKKSWDAPNRKMAVLPILVLILGISYSTFYNLKVPFFREIPLALGMGSLLLLFWSTILKSGLIPSNRGYHDLFEHSLLDMRIFDRSGELRFRSAGAEVEAQAMGGLPEKDWKENQKSAFVAAADNLLWVTSIRGGRIVTQENIQELSSLKKNLERVTKELEEENLILSKKEQVESRLILVREQNELTEEVNRLVEDKIHKMTELLQEIKARPQLREKGLIRLQRLAIYCKRRCELLIKSKQQELCTPADLSRLMDEINLGTFSGYQFFYGLSSGIPFPAAAEAYELCHLFYDWALTENITTMTIRLFQEKDELCLYFLIESENDRQRQSLQAELDTLPDISYKELGDAFSVLLPIREGML